MRLLDWFLFGCLVASSGAGAWACWEARQLLAALDLTTNAGEADWWALRDLDQRVTHATTVARATGQTDIAAILEGNNP